MKRAENPTHPTNLTKPKSDREVQFFEADECKDIIPKCTKKEIEEFILQNQHATGKEIYEKFGTGSLKFRNELKREGLI